LNKCVFVCCVEGIKLSRNHSSQLLLLEHGINSLHGPFEPDFGTTMAGVLKKQRKIPTDHRAHVKKLLAQIEDSIANLKPSLHDKLSQQKIILREKLDTLKTLNSKILELVDDKNEDESIEHEAAEASEITDEITWAVVCIHWTLKSLQINLSIPTTPSTSSGNISSSPQSGLLLSGATAALNVEIHAKLPKLEMRRFNGQPTE